MQAAIGSAQMEKLSDFCEQRKKIFRNFIQSFQNILIISYFFSNKKCRTGLVCFYCHTKENIPFTRNEITNYLNDKLIETRNLFGGNLSKQPAFIDKYGEMQMV